MEWVGWLVEDEIFQRWCDGDILHGICIVKLGEWLFAILIWINMQVWPAAPEAHMYVESEFDNALLKLFNEKREI